MYDTPINVIQAIYTLVSNGWCKGAYALDSNDLPCDVTDPNARRFCLLGAYLKVAKEKNLPEATERLVYKAINAQVGIDVSLITYNDTFGRTQSDVCRVLLNALNSRHIYE